MAEKPIPFSGPMVRAILEGRKTMTRRVVKVPISGDCTEVFYWSDQEAKLHLGEGWKYSPTGLYERGPRGLALVCKCPYGKVGNRLWVKETFTTFKSDSREEAEDKFQAGQNIKSLDDLYNWAKMPSGGGQVKVLYKADFGDWADNPDSDLGPWKSPRFMPRWASRITLEVTSVRAERLRDISREDANAEGIQSLVKAGWNAKYEGVNIVQNHNFPEENFIRLFYSINKLPSRLSPNPWVWVIEFKVVK